MSKLFQNIVNYKEKKEWRIENAIIPMIDSLAKSQKLEKLTLQLIEITKSKFEKMSVLGLFARLS